MTTKELIAQVSTQSGLKKTQVEALLQTMVSNMTDAFQEGKGVHIQNFGDWEVKLKNARMSVHPRTKVRTLTPAKKQLTFKQNSTLKEELKNV